MDFTEEQIKFLTEKGFEFTQASPEEPEPENSISKFPEEAQKIIKELREENKNKRLKYSEMEEKFNDLSSKFESIEKQKAEADAEAAARKEERLKKEGNYEALYSKAIEELEKFKSSYKDYSELKEFKENHTQKLQKDFEADLAQLPDEETKAIYQNLGLSGHDALKKYLKTITSPGNPQSYGSEKQKVANGIPVSLDGLGMDDLVELSNHHPEVYQKLVQEQMGKK